MKYIYLFLSKRATVSLSFISLFFISSNDLNIKTPYYVYPILYLLVTTAYNLNNKLYIKYIKKIFFNYYFNLSLLCTFSSIILKTFLNKNNYILICLITISFIITFFYNIPLPVYNKTLRELKYLKIFLVSFSWSCLSVVSPIVINNFYDYEIYFIIILLIRNFIMVLILIIPFEIRDLYYDKKTLGTITQTIGIKKSKIVSYFLILINLYIVLKNAITIDSTISWLIGFVLITTLTILSTPKRKKYFYSLLVESIPIVMAIVYILLKA